MNKQKLEVLLVDDHPTMRLGLAAVLRHLDYDLMFHEAGNAEQATEICAAHSPRLALVDLSLPGGLSIDLIRHIRATHPCAAILVVTMYAEEDYAERVIHAGANGYIVKNNAAESLIEAAGAVLRGEMWLSDGMRDQLGQSGSGISSLSDRQLEIFILIGRGVKKSEIVQILNLSPNTIEKHRENIKRKLGISTGAELYRLAALHVQE